MTRAADDHSRAYAILAVARREYERLTRAAKSALDKLSKAEGEAFIADQRYRESLDETGGEIPPR